MKTLWWVASGIMICVFLPAGLLMLAGTILKEISECIKIDESIPQNTYSNDTLNDYR